MSKKLWSLFSVLLVATMLLAACAQPTTEAPKVEPTKPPEATKAPEPTKAPEATKPPEPTKAPEPTATTAPTEPPAALGTLRIWADDTRAPIVEDLRDEVLAAYQLELVVELKSALRDDFQVAAPVGEGPDILFGVPHDQAGTLVSNGLLAPIDLGDKAADFAPVALEACTFDGVLYCMPYATENLGFFYNTDLVETPPTTWDEVVEMGEALMAEGKATYIMAATGTTYDLYPLFTAFGGYIFGKDENGNWNAQDLGLDSEGMIAAAQWLKDNVDKGNLPTDWDWANNHALFENGEVPFIMAGPWALDRIGQSGIPYAVTNFPAGPAGAGAPFAGTQGIYINAASENALLAQAFLTEYVATEEVMQKLYEAGKRPSAYLPVLEKTDDPDLLAMGMAGANAVMMPAIPEMGSVWGNWNDAIVLVRDGKQDAETALKEGAAKIRNLIANPLTGMVNVPGSYQAQAGCDGDWKPECAATAMTKGDDGKYRSGPFDLKAGEYAVKVALDGSWTTNYGSDGKQDGPDYKFTLDKDGKVSFEFDPETKLLTITIE
jgi:maltose/maltodextrin transport system substrate-binding protein/arabinogalactan oligomer/maltooligosaccharide transport system substrate-binding protein